MKNACTIKEIFMLYIFSLWYAFKEFLAGFFAGRGLVGKLFMTCEGRTALITGGTSGIGLETVKKLLSFGMNVIIGSNLPAEDAKRCVEQLRTHYPGRKVEIWYVDLASMDSVKSFCERYLTSGMPLHILINNAGIMFAPYEKTIDGLESHFAINYLSHCLLTKLLLPRLKRSSVSNCCARIVNVSSCLHYLANADFPPFMKHNDYCPHQSYMQSKLFQLMFTLTLSKYLSMEGSSVIANAIHPGVCYSPLYRHVGWTCFFLPFILPKPKRGADVSIYTALSAEVEQVGGKYIEGYSIKKPSALSENPELQTRLWNETWTLLKPWLDEIDPEPELSLA